MWSRQFVRGYGYGRKQHKADSRVEKLAGQVFWQMLTGEDDYYLRIAQAIGRFSRQHGEEYSIAYTVKKRQLLHDFRINFVSDNGDVLWDKVVTFNSGGGTRKRLLRSKAVDA